MDFVSLDNFLDNSIFKVCGCCLNENGEKDVFTVLYNDNENRENYEEIIKTTFNIDIFQDLSKQYPDFKLHICEGCIAKLRNAHSFKNIILKNREILKHRIKIWYETEKESNMEIIKSQPPLHFEENDNDDDPNDSNDDPNDCNDDPNECNYDPNDSFDDDKILAQIKIEMKKSNETAIFNIQDGGHTKRKKHESKLKKCKNNEEMDKSQKDWSKLIEHRGIGPILRENSLKLISNSSLCVFQWNKSRYRCFCCKEPFSDINLLKEHTKSHTIEEINKKIITQQNRLVKVEISNLFCNICNKMADNLQNLKLHLKEHNIFLTEDLLVPFKIENELKCQLCFEKFSVFRLLNIHMNKHYQNQVCHICGAAFSNLVFLNQHKVRNHKPLQCKKCNLLFKNKSEQRLHDSKLHGLKLEKKSRFPCPFCPERFYQENFKILHLVEKHGLKRPEFTCNVCNKVYITRSLLNNHVKMAHLKEKIHECEVCRKLFYTKSDVSRHKVTHSGKKEFSCLVCNNPFASKDSLRRHMKRTHCIN